MTTRNSYDELADYVTHGYWKSTGSEPHAFDVESGGVLTANITALTPEGQQLAKWAFEAWTNVTGINFEFITGEADISFTVEPAINATARSTWLISGDDSQSLSPIQTSIVNIPPDTLTKHGTTIDSYSFTIFLHEIGHALGLGHPGPYNFDGIPVVYGVDNIFSNDSQQATVMSYFNQRENTNINASFAYTVTPMIADIIAIQSLYGVPRDIRSGDTVYGYRSNVDGYLGEFFARWTDEKSPSLTQPTTVTLYDNGGIDTLDLRTDTTNQRVDLHPEGISDVYGLIGNLVIARDTLIENFIAGSGDDTVAGNAVANRLEGGPGNDELRGNGDNDILEGGPGADRLDGGAGVDWASYQGSNVGVTVKLKDGRGQNGHAEGDVLFGIENIAGSGYRDILEGNNDANELLGNAGDDYLDGAEGNDRLYGAEGDDLLEGGEDADWLDGGAGGDRASYRNSDEAVTVELKDGTGKGGEAEGDTLVDIEHIYGSPYDDSLTGNDSANWLEGGAGADRLDGGAGSDWALYWRSDTGVTLNLKDGIGEGGHAEGDTLVDIEHIYGSPYDDSLTGNDGANRLEGGAGADRLDGGAGGDTVSYWNSDEAVTVNLKDGTSEGGHAEGDTLVDIEHIVGSPHDDSLAGNDSANRLEGRAGADRLDGGEGDDRLEGEAGADRLDGGAGSDWALYWGSATGVAVNLKDGTGKGGEAEGDTLVDIEHIVGSPHDDSLAGNDSANRLEGRAGADRLDGGKGNDWLEGEAGADRLDGGEGVDWASYQGSDMGVTVNLKDGRGQNGHAEGDVLFGIENITGSYYADILEGDDGANELLGNDGDDHLNGREGNDHLDGGEGDDLLEGGAGADRLDGGEGDDLLEGGAGSDRLNGGAGEDGVSYWNSDEAVTVDLKDGTGEGGEAEGDTLVDIEDIIGSSYDDTLTGNNRANWLVGGPGADRLDGGEGDDWLEGGTGSDRLNGGAGEDIVLYWSSDEAVIVDLKDGTGEGGEAEGDTLIDIEYIVGSSYDDALTGNDSTNLLEGGAGADRLDGGEGDDLLEGGAGADRLNGGAGEDIVLYWSSDEAVTVDLKDGTGEGGEAEGDTLVDIEHIIGSAYDDILTGNDNANWLEGGSGADRLDGGAGSDWALYWYSDTGVTVKLKDGRGQNGHAEGDMLFGIENITGSDYGDILEGDSGANWLVGGLGDDHLDGGEGSDHLDGEAGEDTVSYWSSDEAVAVNLKDGTSEGGHAEGDTLVDIEHIVGSSYDDALVGNDSPNRLEGGAGADRLDGGAGIDWVSYQGSDEGVTVKLEDGRGQNGHAEGDVLFGIENIAGSDYGDILEGDNGPNWLQGGSGDDYLDAGEGNDLLEGGAGADRLGGGEGQDTVSYGNSDEAVTVKLKAGTGEGGHAEGDMLADIESIYGSSHDDTLIGDGNVNVLEGGPGADRLDGGAGIDTVSYQLSDVGVAVNLKAGTGKKGEAEGDTLVGIEHISGSSHDDMLIGDDDVNLLEGGPGADWLDGGAGIDWASYQGSDAAVTVKLKDGRGQNGHAEGDVLFGIENITGSDYGDILGGDNGANHLVGEAGNDGIWSSGGDDILDGGTGADRLYASIGDDYLDGGEGNDRLEGGDGADIFIFAAGHGEDTILDFTDSEDLIDLTAFDLSGFDQLSVSSDSDGVTLDLTASGGGTILLQGFDMANLDAADFLF